MRTEQEGCPLAASDINAAQGITSVSTVVEQTGEEQRQKAPEKKVVMKVSLAEEAPSADVEETAQKEDAEEVLKNTPVTTVADFIMAEVNKEDIENDAVVVKAASEEGENEEQNAEPIKEENVV